MSDHAQLKKELEAARAAAAELKAKNEALKEEVDRTRATPTAIKGSFEAVWKTPMGKEVKRKFGFVPGHKYVYINDKSLKDYVKISTEALLSLANGKKLPEEVAIAFPWLTQEKAADHLTHLAKVGYGYLEDRK